MDVVTLMTTFVSIAESGSISNAARNLRLSVPMASRHLRALEDELGVSLVRRTTRRMDLTDAGSELLPRARRVLREVDDAFEAVRPSKLATGELVISLPVAFGLVQVGPLIPALLAQHPHLSLDVRFDDRFVDLVGEGVDLAVRVGARPPDSAHIVSRRLAAYERILCASPSLAKKLGVITSVETLASVPCVTLGEPPTRWQFETRDGPRAVVVEGRIRCNNMLIARDAALSGLGVAQLPRWLIARELKARRLVRVLESATLPTIHVLGLVHTHTRRSNSLRIVQDFLAAKLPHLPEMRPATTS
jgi:DNA-binding transcriptional LysR family regulator